jgi:uncharacterized protein DUF2459
MMTVCLFFMAKIGLDLSIFRKAGFVGQYGRRIFFLRSDPTSLSPAAGRIGIGVGDDFYALLVAADADAVDDTVAAGSMRLRWRGFASAAVCLLGVLGGWVAAPAASGPLSAARDDLIYVIAGGWHTEIAVPKGAIAGRLATVAAGFAGARYVVFGWGARGFYMAQNPGFADLLRAAVPGPAVVLVIPLSVSPGAYFGDANVWPIPVSPDGVNPTLAISVGQYGEGSQRRTDPCRRRALSSEHLLRRHRGRTTPATPGLQTRCAPPACR